MSDFTPEEISGVYLLISTVISDKAEEGRRGYRFALQQWCEFLGAQWGTDEAISLMLSATKSDGLSFKNWLHEQPGIPERGTKKATPAAPATVRKKLAMLRKIYGELQAEGVAPKNPFFSIPLPSINKVKRPINMLPFDKAMELISAPGNADDRGIRDSAILAVLYGGGLRVGEVADLKIEDVRESQSGILSLYLDETKGKTIDDHALPDWAAEKVAQWTACRLMRGARNWDPLFTSFTPRGQRHTNRRMASGSVFRLHREYLGKVGLNPVQYSPHSGRVTSITKLLTDGHAHRDVKQFSRHKSIQMVDHYDRNYVSKERSLAIGLAY